MCRGTSGARAHFRKRISRPRFTRAPCERRGGERRTPRVYARGAGRRDRGRCLRYRPWIEPNCPAAGGLADSPKGHT